MKNGCKFNVGLYCFAFVGGLLSGLLFKEARYYQGKADAYNEMTDILNETIQNSKGVLDNQ